MTNLVDVKYSKQELDSYANSSDTCVTLVRKKRDVLLYPVQLSDLRAGVRQNMDALLLKYDYLFNSIILGYNRIKILSKCGLICHANARIKVQIEADFYLFNPAVGSKLKGVVCKRSGHHLGCLVHKAFNAYIPTKDDNHKSEFYYFIGQDLTFTVVDLDLTSGRLPYLRGQLDDENTERSDGDSIINQVGPDSGTSFSHEEDAGGWDSGIASSPGKYTLANEDIESEDKYNYGMKRGVDESMVTSKTVQLVAGNTTNKLKNSPKTDAGVENLSSIAKVLDKYYSSQDYGVSDDESQQSVQETIKESGSFSTDNSPVAKGKSKSRIKKNGSTLKNKEKLKLTSWDPENSITEESKTSSSPVNSDEKIRNTAQEIIEMTDVTSKVTTTPSKKKTKSNSKKDCSSSSPNDLIKQLLKSMESSFVEEEEIDSSEKKDLENTAILTSPVKVAEEMEEICKEGESKLKIQQTKGENEVSLKSPSSTTKRRKSPSKVKNISTPEKKYLGSGGSQTLLNDSVAAEDSKSKQESQKNLEESGSPSVDGVVAVKKKRKSKNSNDESPLKTVSLGDAKTSIREGPNIPILIQSDEKTPQKSTDMALTISNVHSSSAKKKGKSVSKKNRSSSSPDDLIKQLLKSMESSFVEEEIDSSEKKDLGNAAITSPPVKVVVDSEGVGKEDKSKIISLEVSEDSGISVKKPTSATKKRKSMSKVKKEGSPGKVGVINDVSEKKDMGNTVITPLPVKVDSEGMGNKDKSKIRSEVYEDSGISVKKPTSATKKRKSMSKVKKEGSPGKVGVINDVSEKKDMGNTVITPLPVKVDSEGMGNKDKSKIRSEVYEDSGISVKKPSSATKKRKSMSKVKKEVSPGKVGLINDVSEKKDMENTVITPPVKVVVDSEGMGNEDKSKSRSLEVSEDSGISVKKPSSTTKKRKSMSKVKKEGSPDKEDLITKLLKNVERSIFETDITQDKSLENEKGETTVGVNANVTERNKQARKSTGSLKEKKISMKETSSNSEKKADNLVDNYLEQIKTHILSKHEALYDLKSTVELSTKGKNKGRHSTSNISPVSSNTRDEKAIALESEMIEGSDIEKLTAKNENLLDIEHGSKDVISLKDEIPTMKDKKAKKRKRESMDLIENPQRIKVAKYSEI